MRIRTRCLALLAALFVAASTLAPRAARAQSGCASGRVVGPATAGRCCWPGQRWSASAARCEGAPRCPPGTAASGDECVVVSNASPATADTPVPTPTPAPQRDAVAQDSAPQTAAPPPVASAWDAVRAQPRPYDGGPVPEGWRVQQRSSPGLLGGGAAIFSAGYIWAVTGGLLLGAGYGFIALIPIVGPIIEGAALSASTSYFAMQNSGWLWGVVAVPSVVLQAGGAVMFGFGVRGRPWLVPRQRAWSRRSPPPATWTVLPSAAGAQVGATFVLTHL